MSLPDFLIVGAAKCGTTSLFDQLSRHPDVFTSIVKEPGFFISQNHLSSIRNWKDYQSLFKGKKDKIAGEASVSYLYDSKSPELIIEKLGNEVKIVIIMRNPIEMAFSLWKHRRRELNEDLDFFDAIQAWEKRSMDTDFTEKNIAYEWNYIGRAQFYEQVKRYLDRFKNVRIFFFEEYMADPIRSFRELCEFLGINKELDVELELKNKAFYPKYGFLQKLLIKRMPTKELLKKILPIEFLMKIKLTLEKANRNEVNQLRLSQEERKKLIPYFHEDVEKLSRLLNKDLKRIWTDFDLS